jgi:hypothetical protein
MLGGVMGGLMGGAFDHEPKASSAGRFGGAQTLQAPLQARIDVQMNQAYSKVCPSSAVIC